MGKYIYYTTTDNTIIDDEFINLEGSYGANIINHTYSNGQGVIEFDGDVTEIPSYFCGADFGAGPTNLKTIKFPNTIKSIGYHVLYYSSGNDAGEGFLTSVDLSECTELETIDESFCEVGYSRSTKTNITEIDLSNCNKLRSIGHHFFDYTQSLKTIKWPKNGPELSIGRYLVSEGIGFEEFELPKNLVKWDGPRMNSWNNLKTIIIPDGECKLSSGGYGYPSSVNKIILSPDATGWEWFIQEFPNAEVVVVNDNGNDKNGSKYIKYTTIDDLILEDYFIPTEGWGANIVSHTYENGQGVIEFDGDVTAIPDRFCYDNTSDEKVKIRIKTIKFPNSIETIGDYVMCEIGSNNWEAPFLYDIDLSECDKLVSIGEYFCTCLNSGIECIDLTGCKSLESIGVHCFSNLKELKYLILPDSLTRIGSQCFTSLKKLEKFIFPKNITSMSYLTFNYCDYLKEIVFTSEKALNNLGLNSVFSMTSEDGVFKVPKGSDWKEKFPNSYKNWTMVEESEMDRIERGKEWIKYGIEYYGVTVPDDAKIEEYPKYIEGINKSKVFISESVDGDKMTYLNHSMKLSGDIKTIYVSSESDWSTSESDTYHHISPTSGKAGEYIPVQISIPTVSENVNYEFKFFTNDGYETIYKITQTK